MREWEKNYTRKERKREREGVILGETEKDYWFRLEMERNTGERN